MNLDKKTLIITLVILLAVFFIWQLTFTGETVKLGVKPTPLDDGGGSNDNINTIDTYTTCKDSDNGLNYFEKGFVETSSSNGTLFYPDSCITNSQDSLYHVREYYCDNNDNALSKSYNCSITEYVCMDGACVNSTLTCADSDSGLNYFESGTANSSDGSNFKDYCSSSTMLVEAYCQNVEYGQVATATKYSCSNIGYVCSKEICIPSTTTTTIPILETCTDTDAGKDYYNAGTVKYIFNDNSYLYNDVCRNNKNLLEYYCLGSTPNSIGITCSKGCKSGACIKP